MRDLKEIEKIRGLHITTLLPKEGIVGYYKELEYTNKNIKFGKEFMFVFTWNHGWEHLSVSTKTRCPTWEEMCKFKDIFFTEDEACVEYHPKKSDYVNLHPYCLHIWKPLEVELPLPDKSLVY